MIKRCSNPLLAVQEKFIQSSWKLHRNSQTSHQTRKILCLKVWILRSRFTAARWFAKEKKSSTRFEIYHIKFSFWKLHNRMLSLSLIKNSKFVSHIRLNTLSWRLSLRPRKAFFSLKCIVFWRNVSPPALRLRCLVTPSSLSLCAPRECWNQISSECQKGENRIKIYTIRIEIVKFCVTRYTKFRLYQQPGCRVVVFPASAEAPFGSEPMPVVRE